MKNIILLVLVLIVSLFFTSCSKPNGNLTLREASLTANSGVFTKKQVELGEALYTNSCVACHGRDLRGTEGGTALLGERFISKWKEKSLGELFELTKATMPKTNPHSLDDASYAALLAFIFGANEFQIGRAHV